MSLSKKILYNLNVTNGRLLSNNLDINTGTINNLSSNVISGGNLSLSGNLVVGGTLTTVNITTTNIKETNVSAGSVTAINSLITNQTVSSSIITNQTVGSSFVTGNVTFGSNVVVVGPALQLPSGNIASRPIAAAGYVRYNTETQQFEGYGPGNAWGSLGGVVDIAQTTKVLASASPSTTDGNLYFYTVNNERMRINSVGNVGIGTTAPGALLDVAGTLLAVNIKSTNVTSTNALITNVSSTNSIITNVSAGTVNVTNQSVTNQTIGSSFVTGNVTFGSNVVVVGPALQLPTGNIASRPGAPAGGYVRYNTETQQFEGYGPGNAWGSLGGVVDIAQTTKVLASASPSTTDGNLYFYTVGDERMRINSVGNVGIGTTAPGSLLEVAGGFRSTTATVTNLLTTNVTTTTLNVSTGITTPTAQITNSNVINQTVGSQLATNVSSTNNTATNLLSTNSSIANLRTDLGVITNIISVNASILSNVTVPNSLSTNITTATLNASTGITTPSAQITNSNVTTSTIGTLLNTNTVSTNISSATLNLSTGITTPSAQITNSNVTTSTIGTILNTNTVSTNVSSATLNLSTGITAASAQITNSNVTSSTTATARITSNLIALGNSNTIGNIFTTGGNIGLGTVTPALDFHISKTTNSEVSTIISNLSTGGSALSSLRLGNNNTNANAILFLNSTTRTVDGGVSTLTIRNDGGSVRLLAAGSAGGVYVASTTGNVGINIASPSYHLDVNGNVHVNANLYVDGLISGGTETGSTFAYLTLTSTDDSINLSTGSFVTYGGVTIQSPTDAESVTNGGSLLTDGGASVGKRLFVGTGLVSANDSNTMGNVFTTGGNVGVGTVTPSHVLDVNGGFRSTTATISNIVSTNITAATLNVSDGITSANARITSLTTSNLVSNNVNLGISSFFSGSFSASNNMSVPTNVTGFAFANADTRSFQSTVTVTILRSSGGNLYEQFTIYGFQTESGWTIYVSKLGDDSGYAFSITAAGQMQYTSPNTANFTSSTVRYSVTQISNTGTYSFSGMSSGGTVLIDSVQIQNTQNSIIGTNTGSLYVLGGSTLTKTVNILTTENAIGLGTGGGLSVFGGTAISKDLYVGGNATIANIEINGLTDTLNFTATTQTVATSRITTSLLAIGNSNTVGNVFTTGGNVGIGTTSPVSRLHLASSNTVNNIVFEVGTTAEGGNSGWSAVNFNGYHSGGETRINTNKNRWRMSVDQRSSVDQLAFDTWNGSTLTTVMSFTTQGNVGVGTSTPLAKLHILGNGSNTNFEGSDHVYQQFYPYGIGGGRKAFVGFGNPNNKTFDIYNEATSGNLNLTNAAGGAISLVNHTITTLTATGGNVGIGITTPSSRLHIYGTGTSLLLQDPTSGFEKGVVKFWDDHHAIYGRWNYNNQNVNYLNYYAYTGHTWYGGNNVIASQSEMMRLNGSGTLSVNGNVGVENGYFEGLNESNNITANTEWTLIRARNGAGIWGLKGTSNNSGSLIFKTHTTYNTPVERMRITDSGNVGIDTVPDNAKLHLANTFGGPASILKISKGGTATWGSQEIYNNYRYITAGGNAEHTKDFNVGPGGVGIGYAPPIYTRSGSDGLYVNGRVGLGTNSPSYQLQIDSAGVTDGTLMMTNSVGGSVIMFTDIHHSIWGRRGYDGVIDKIQFREYGQIEFWTGGLIGNQTNKMTVKASGGVDINGTCSADNMLIRTANYNTTTGTQTWSANTWYTIIPTNTLVQFATYIVTLTFSAGNTPWNVYTSFLFLAGYTNDDKTNYISGAPVPTSIHASNSSTVDWQVKIRGSYAPGSSSGVQFSISGDLPSGSWDVKAYRLI
jgi:hypothetical protein